MAATGFNAPHGGGPSVHKLINTLAHDSKCNDHLTPAAKFLSSSPWMKGGRPVTQQQVLDPAPKTVQRAIQETSAYSNGIYDSTLLTLKDSYGQTPVCEPSNKRSKVDTIKQEQKENAFPDPHPFTEAFRPVYTIATDRSELELTRGALQQARDANMSMLVTNKGLMVENLQLSKENGMLRDRIQELETEMARMRKELLEPAVSTAALDDAVRRVQLEHELRVGRLKNQLHDMLLSLN